MSTEHSSHEHKAPHEEGPVERIEIVEEVVTVAPKQEPAQEQDMAELTLEVQEQQEAADPIIDPFSVLLQGRNDIDQIRSAILLRMRELGGGEEDEQLTRGRDLFYENATKAGSIEFSLDILRNAYSNELIRALDYVDRNAELMSDPNFARSLREPGKKAPILGPRGVRSKVDPTQDLRGADAVKAFESQRPSGVVNIPLYASGIVVAMRQPTLAEINVYLNNCRQTFGQYGGLLGAHYYLFEDFLIFKHTINFLMPLMVDTSLQNWREPDGRTKVISRNDIQHLLAEVAVAMYPQGYKDFVTICPPSTTDVKMGCGHTEKLHVDIREFIKTRYSAMPREYINFMVRSLDTSSVKHTAEKIEEMRKSLGHDTTVTVGDRRFHLSPPSVYTYLTSGDQVYADTLADLQGSSEDEHLNVVNTRIFRFFLPWVTKAEQIRIDPEDGAEEVLAFTTDRGPIAYFLDRIMTDEDAVREMEEKLVAMVDNSIMTHIVYKAMRCPKCGYTPGGNSGVVSVDIRSAFFTLAEAKSPRGI